MSGYFRIYGVVKNTDGTTEPSSWTNTEDASNVAAQIKRLEQDEVIVLALAFVSSFTESKCPPVDEHIRKDRDRFVSIVEGVIQNGGGWPDTAEARMKLAALTGKPVAEPKLKGHWWEVPPATSPGFPEKTMAVTRSLCGG